MASNGSFNTTPYSNRYVTFSWSTYERSIEGNYTTIYWELKGAGSQTQWLKSGPFTVVIDGETVYNSSTRIQLDQGTFVASGYKTIYHDSTGYREFSASVSAAIYTSAVNCWGSGSWVLDSIPRAAKITSAPDFDDTWDSYKVGIDNPAGSAVAVWACISWTGGDDIAYRELSWDEKENGYYTFYFTEEERAKLRSATVHGSTSRYVTVYISTYSSTGVVISYSTKQVLFTVTDCKPILNPTVIDEGSGSTKLTGSTQDKPKMIRGFNCLYAAFNASAPKGGSIVSKTVTCGGKTLYGDGYFGDGLTYHVYDNEFVFTVTDNRGQTVEKTVTIPAIDYIPLTCNLSYETDLSENNTANVTITISGNYFNGSFGAVDNVLDLQCICRKDGEEYPKDDSGNYIWTKINYSDITFSDGKYSTVINIPDADYKATYIVQAWAADEVNVSGLYAKEQRIKITPVFDWGENDFNFNVPVFKEGNPIGYYPVGAIYSSESDVNPGTLFGGTWQLMRTFYGGELVAYGTAWNSESIDKTFDANTYYGISDVLGGVYTDSLHNYIPDILTGSSGTIWVQTKGIVGLVEANLEISGCTDNSGCNGIWFYTHNKNTLPAGVILRGGGTLHTVSGYYGGNSTRYFYDIANNDTGTSFFVNPQWTPYGGSFRPCLSGVRSILQVKAFAKGGTTYMWKRIA